MENKWLWMGYYPEPDSHVDKVKVVLGLSNYATKKELDYAKIVDTSDLAAKKILLLWKLQLKKQKVYNLDASKLKTVPVDLKKSSDVVNNEVVKRQSSTH